MSAPDFARLQTPALLLDERKLDRNIARMKARMDAKGAALRPHIKTAKSHEVYARALDGAVGVTVSTLAEAEYAFDHGVRDILYAVGMAPTKPSRALALRARGAELTLIIDSMAAARAVSDAGAAAGVIIPLLIEIDSDDHRAGVKPVSRDALALAQMIGASAGAEFRGLMTHAGGSYDCRGGAAIRAMAERERRAIVDTVAMLSQNGIASAIRSVGSTPTAAFGENFDGLSDVRVGVYMFMDLVMASPGVCAIDDIAISVLASVIGHQPGRGEVLVDAGWMALSRDRGTAAFDPDYGYGLVCDAAGAPLGDLVVQSCNQEHGIIARAGGGPVDLAAFPVGRMLRILPNHACATAAQFPAYDVIGADGAISARYARHNGW